MRDYDAYLFDWDGTLAQSHDMFLGIIHGQLESRGIRLTDEEIVRQLFGRYDEGLRELGFSEDTIRELAHEIRDIAKKQYLQINLFPQAREMLVTLKRQGKKICLVTATARDVIDVATNNHQVLEFFDAIIAGDEMTAQKPDPGGLFTVLKQVQVLPNRAIMIGDSPKDLLAGNNAGTDTLLFYPPEHETQHPLSELQKCNPTYTVRAWQELLDRLQ